MQAATMWEQTDGDWGVIDTGQLASSHWIAEEGTG